MKRDGLKRARKRGGFSQQVIAERMGVSVPQVSRWESGENSIPPYRWRAMVEAYESTIEELELFEEAGVYEPNARVIRYEGASDVELRRDLPILGTSLGASLEFDGTAIEQTMLNSAEIIGYLPRPTVLNDQKGAYGLYVQGSSMAPRYEDGETIFVQDSRQGRPPGVGDDVVLYLVDLNDEVGERAAAVLLKRLVRRTASYVELEQFNPATTFKIERERVLRIDRVISWRELLS